jgi:hypothetical protein
MVAAPAQSADQSAIQQVIQQSDNEQAQALSSGDPTLMQDTSTSDHYQDLVQTNQDLTAGGVTSISLIKVDWGQISVNGTTATATDYETWRQTFSDGTSAQSRDENDYTLVQANGGWKISSDDNPTASPASSGSGSTSPQGSQPPSSSPSTSDSSTNWAGYAATGGTFTSVTGTWTIPAYTANSTAGVDATWVGIGGVSSTDLIQAGTDQETSGTGQTQYEAWIETLPRASQPVNLTVNPGDSITVTISQTSKGNWSISMKNNTTGQSYQTNVKYNSSLSSAEWIQEAPSGVRSGVLPLDNFGTVNFTSGSAVENGQTVNIAQSGAQPITLETQRGQVLASPSSLGSDGASFSVTRTSTASTPTPTTSSRGSGSSGRSGSGGGPSIGNGSGNPSIGGGGRGSQSHGYGY